MSECCLVLASRSWYPGCVEARPLGGGWGSPLCEWLQPHMRGAPDNTKEGVADQTYLGEGQLYMIPKTG